MREFDGDFNISGWRRDLERADLIRDGAVAAAPFVGDAPIVTTDRPWDLITVMENQRSQGSCQGHMGSYLDELCFKIATGGQKIQLSRQYAYIRTQRFDGIRGDNGSTIYNGIQKVLCGTGLPLEEHWPYPSRYQTDPPSPHTWAECDADAAHYVCDHYSTATGYDYSLQFLARGRGGVGFGIIVPSGFTQNRGIIESYSGRGSGGHALCWLFISPRLDSSGRNYLWGPNSWGETWGNRGWAEWSPSAVDAVCQHSDFGCLAVSDMKSEVDRPIDFVKNAPGNAPIHHKLGH